MIIILLIAFSIPFPERKVWIFNKSSMKYVPNDLIDIMVNKADQDLQYQMV